MTDAELSQKFHEMALWIAELQVNLNKLVARVKELEEQIETKPR